MRKHKVLAKVMLKILQARLQQYVSREFPDVQAGFRKGRGTRNQIANRFFQESCMDVRMDYKET